jgi:hypothetical protein
MTTVIGEPSVNEFKKQIDAILSSPPRFKPWVRTAILFIGGFIIGFVIMWVVINY